MKLKELLLARGERGLLVGETRTGKSTLANVTLDQWVESDNRARLLLIDTKPRFKAQYDHTGLRCAWRYANWDQGVEIPHSFRLRIGATKRELHQYWDIVRANTPKNRGSIIIAQVPINEEDVRVYYRWLDYIIRVHYAHISKKWHNYLYVDEMLAFSRVSRNNNVGVIQFITAGGELGHTFLGGTQRPFWIPKEAMSELTRLYAFQLSELESIKRLHAMGLPDEFQFPVVYHEFMYYNKPEKILRSVKLSEDLARKFGGKPPTGSI